MYIVIDVAQKTIQIDANPSISCEGWHYLRNLNAMSKLTYDTKSKMGYAHWLNPAFPSMELHNPVYAEFVQQLVRNVTKYIAQTATTSNVVDLKAYKDNMKRHTYAP